MPEQPVSVPVALVSVILELMRRHGFNEELIERTAFRFTSKLTMAVRPDGTEGLVRVRGVKLAPGELHIRWDPLD